MKVKSKTDTTAGANEKVKLIDGFGFNGSYQLSGGSFQTKPYLFLPAKYTCLSRSIFLLPPH